MPLKKLPLEVKKPDCFNSYVNQRGRDFHEDIEIPGTDITLHYASNRTAGYRHGISVPASGDEIPEGLIQINVKVDVAGRTFEQDLDPLPNQKAQFIWDGLDHLGRQVEGSTTAYVAVGFVYKGVYTVPPDLAQAFAMTGQDLTSVITREKVTLWQKSTIDVPIPPAVKGKGTIADGWTLSVHHYLDPKDRGTLHKGNGTISAHLATIIDRVVGNETSGYSGDGGPANEAQLGYPEGLAVAGTGDLYIADSDNYRIRKVDANGIITTIAGIGTSGYSGDGGLATEAEFYYPIAVVVDAQGSIYIADRGEDYEDVYPPSVRKVNTDGIITTIAGCLQCPNRKDGMLASEANWDYINDIELDDSGNLYILEENTVWKMGPDGIIRRVAGDGTYGYSGDGGPAREARLGYPGDIAIDASGYLYIADRNNDVIRMVDIAGIITTVVGNGTRGFSGDGGPALEAQLNHPLGITVDAYGNLFIADDWNDVVRVVNGANVITTIAGTGEWGYSGDGGPAIKAQISAHRLQVDSLGDLYLSDPYNNVVRKIAPISGLSSFTAASDFLFVDISGLGHVISSAGQHKKSFDGDTGVVLYEFGYDGDNNLISISDQFGNETIINRNAGGIPTAVVSPDGLTTNLTIDSDNHLKRITYPDSNFYSFEYTPDGLMTIEIEPEGNQFDHDFDDLGGLTDIFDEEGGNWNYNRITYPNGDMRVEVLTGEGNLTSFLDHTGSAGDYSTTITDPTGAQTRYSESPDGLYGTTDLPCGMVLNYNNDLDSEYKFKYVKELTESTPTGLKKVTLRNKTYEDTDSDDRPDLITESISVNSKVITNVHNTLQALKFVSSPEGRTVTSHYNPATLRVESVSVPGLHPTAYGYDARGKLTSVSTNTRHSSFTYNANGFLGSVTDPVDHTTTYEYDQTGRITGITRPDGGFVGFTYDNNGNMAVLTNPVDVSHSFGFNTVNRNSSYTTPLSGSYSYVYDKDRQLVQTNFPSGKQIFNVYDNTRLSQIQAPDGNIDFTYLCGTKIDSITKGAESITYAYDGKLVTSEVLSGTLNQSLDCTYNNDFDISGFTYADQTENYSYDNDGLLTTAGDFSITRNAGNGLPEAVFGGELTLARIFNGYGEVQEQNFNVAGSNANSWTLSRDNTGRIVSKIETVGGVTASFAYDYDSMGRLLTVTKDGNLVESYGYDLSGTRTSETNALRGFVGRPFSYSDEDHLLTAGSATYAYDLDGFLTTKTDGGDVTTYSYSSRGELLDVTLPDDTVVEYVHDPLGRRIAKKVDRAITEKYLWQGLTRLLAVYDSSNELLMRFEYADSRMPLAMKSAGNTYYLTYDQVGSLRVVADSAGNVVKRIDYDSFGNIIADTNPALEVPFGFAGGLYDPDTELVRFGFRDYDPDIGRWTAKDPIFFAGGDTDLYGYVLNDPINLIDPDGLKNWGKVVTGGLMTASGMFKAAGGTALAVFGGVELAATPFTAVSWIPGLIHMAEGGVLIVVGGFEAYLGAQIFLEGWREGETDEATKMFELIEELIESLENGSPC
jgi:RHS repeat-associated protein